MQKEYLREILTLFVFVRVLKYAPRLGLRTYDECGFIDNDPL